MTVEQQEAAQKLAELILSHGEKNEATALPYWFVAINASPVGGGGRLKKVSHGIWFNREEAEEHLRVKAHRYPKKAFVYCESGYDSWHMKKLYELAREIVAGDEEEAADGDGCICRGPRSNPANCPACSQEEKIDG